MIYFHPYPWEMIQFDSYFPNGLKPPTRNMLVSTALIEEQVYIVMTPLYENENIVITSVQVY